MNDDLLAPDGHGRDQLETWHKAAHSGDGTPWLSPGDADLLARYGLARGEGVAMMEAVAPQFREPPRDTGWEIIGDDTDGLNWPDHRDPQKAYALFRAKLRKAQMDGAQLQYKIWLAKPQA